MCSFLFCYSDTKVSLCAHPIANKGNSYFHHIYHSTVSFVSSFHIILLSLLCFHLTQRKKPLAKEDLDNHALWKSEAALELVQILMKGCVSDRKLSKNRHSTHGIQINILILWTTAKTNLSVELLILIPTCYFFQFWLDVLLNDILVEFH